MSPCPEGLRCFLYRSQITHANESHSVTDLARAASQFNAQHAITGLLVFDGQRFYQYLEGYPAHLQPLLHSITRDRRHSHFELLYQSGRIQQRRFMQWPMAYVRLKDDLQLCDLDSLRPQQAIARLQVLLPMLDLV